MMLQCSVVCCSGVECIGHWGGQLEAQYVFRKVLKGFVVPCIVLHCVEVYCRVLQYVMDW